jgi:hypothetical protein
VCAARFYLYKSIQVLNMRPDNDPVSDKITVYVFVSLLKWVGLSVLVAHYIRQFLESVPLALIKCVLT